MANIVHTWAHRRFTELFEPLVRDIVRDELAGDVTTTRVYLDGPELRTLIRDQVADNNTKVSDALNQQRP